MKRSEMVEIIAEELYQRYPSELCQYVDMDASNILRLIEKAGMIPPTVRNPEFKDIYKWLEYCDEAAKAAVYGYSNPEKQLDINIWEPEST